jgi:hypothetical protein
MLFLKCSVVSRAHCTFDALELAFYFRSARMGGVQCTWMFWKKTLKNFLECNKDATITYTTLSSQFIICSQSPMLYFRVSFFIK